MGEETAGDRPSEGRRSPAARPTDEQLLDAAGAVFAERGFQRATMGAIAERANSTKPTLYAHFGDKEALYRAAVSRAASALRQWVTTAYESAATLPVDQQVHVYVMALFTYATAHPDGFRMLFDSPATGDAALIRRDLVDTITDRVADQIRRYLAGQDRRPGASADLLAAMMVGIVGQAAEYTLRAGDLDPLAAGEIATRFIMAALTNLDPGVLDPLDRPGRT
ncbi:MAG: TetR family transcriptional regulator [Streptosporangiaceae bacterium]|jgi:AcrR family transcriptional regulator|nr:TetR family transcriptional regulator [Streptosporangiaceae bacterium]